jgi:metal-responsive CopG/Arc/MetJ family transcriptional regulator
MTNKAVRVNASLDRKLVDRIDAYAHERFEDRSTAIRQLVDLALRELAKCDALAGYRRGRLSLREFARALNLDIWAAQDLLRDEGVAVAQGPRSDTADAFDATIRELAEQ